MKFSSHFIIKNTIVCYNRPKVQMAISKHIQCWNFLKLQFRVETRFSTKFYFITSHITWTQIQKT